MVDVEVANQSSIIADFLWKWGSFAFLFISSLLNDPRTVAIANIIVWVTLYKIRSKIDTDSKKRIAEVQAEFDSKLKEIQAKLAHKTYVTKTLFDIKLSLYRELTYKLFTVMACVSRIIYKQPFEDLLPGATEALDELKKLENTDGMLFLSYEKLQELDVILEKSWSILDRLSCEGVDAAELIHSYGTFREGINNDLARLEIIS